MFNGYCWMMKKKYFFLFLALTVAAIGIFLFVHDSNNTREQISIETHRSLKELESLSEDRLEYRRQLGERLDSIMLYLHKDLTLNQRERYFVNKEMLIASQMYAFDYADQFARKMMHISRILADSNLIVEAYTMSSFHLTHAGRFIESLDLMESVDIQNMNVSEEVRGRYYFYYGFLYRQLATYTRDSTCQKYEYQSQTMFQKAIGSNADDGISQMAEGCINVQNGESHLASRHFVRALETLSEEDNVFRSFIYNQLAECHRLAGEYDEALSCYIKAAKFDILHSQTSSLAIINFAEFLFHHYGDVAEASRYLDIAIDGGEFYGMSSQPLCVGLMVQSIAEIKANRVRRVFYGGMLILTVLLLGVIIPLLRCRKVRSDLEHEKERSRQICDSNVRLREENAVLMREKDTLIGSNTLKNVYIGKLLESNSELTNSVAEFSMKANQKLKTTQYDSLFKLLTELDSQFSKNGQAARLDEIILSMFPDYIAEFNSLLKDDKREQDGREGLTPSMRIFALIRLGIKENQQIARILNLSYNTILNYRVRTRGNAADPEHFEQNIMRIGI